VWLRRKRCYSETEERPTVSDDHDVGNYQDAVTFGSEEANQA